MDAAAGAWLSSDKRNCWPGSTPEATVVIAAASYSPLAIAEVRLSTGTASLVRVLPKRSMNSPPHWQGGPPPLCGPPTPSRIWSEEELDG
jgi:hypothetical protein